MHIRTAFASELEVLTRTLIFSNTGRSLAPIVVPCAPNSLAKAVLVLLQVLAIAPAAFSNDSPALLAVLVLLQVLVSAHLRL